MPVSIADLWERIERDIPGLGVVVLENATVGNVGVAERAAAAMPKDQRATLFSNALLASMIISPTSTPEFVATLSEESVAILADIAAGLAGLRKEYDATAIHLPARERLYRAHQNYYRNLFIDPLDSFNRYLLSPIDTLPNIAHEAARHTSISYLVSEEWKQSLHQMGQVDLKLWDDSLGLAHFDLGTQIMQEMSGQWASASLQELVADLVRIKLPEPFLSAALIASGLNSSLVHSPLYQIRSAELIQTAKALSRQKKRNERQRLHDAYDMLITLELRLRELVEAMLRDRYGDPWWRQGVSEAVRRECAERKQARETPFGYRHHPIAYCYVDDLKSIIIRGDNWEQAFQPLFGNKGQVEAIFLWISPVRTDIAHPRPIPDVEYQEFVVAVNWLQRRIALAIGPDLSDE